MATLFIVATPIGNLEDITLRALRVLKEVDTIFCEDTRVTGKLLAHFGIAKPLESLRERAQDRAIEKAIALLGGGKDIAYTTDAGTPGISDPGYAIISRAREEGVPIEVIPGPAAFLTALSGSGLPINQFVYLGFLPLKKGRKTLIESFTNEERTIVFYESVHRIERTLMEIAVALKEEPDRPVVIARELTKMHEEFVRTTVRNLPQAVADIMKKGEYVVVVGNI